MECRNCGHENPTEAQNCAACAAPLVRTCVSCGSEVAAAAKFCSQCGQPLQPVAVADYPLFSSPRSYTPQHLVDKILTARTTLEGERKQVTVLFADIKGSMEVLVERDMEDARTVFHAVVDRMIEAVHRYEGTVHSVMGDGIMALFGAPLAHEDHAVRACFAALRMQENITKYSSELQRTHGAPIMIRVGLNSGEIIISAIGNDLQMDYSVVGQTVHLASRMEQMAKPGSILATADTFRFAEGYIAAKPLGPLPVKGLADEVQIYEVTGAGAARTRLQAAAVRGLTRFVGRDAELRQLRSAQQLASHGRGQVVAIVGPAGVGKSRLVHEFVYSHHADDCLVLESNSASYGHATPYLPVIELLKVYFSVNGTDSVKLIREKVSAKILKLDPSLQDAILPVLDLLNALESDHPFRSLDPLQHRYYTYQAIVRLFLGEAKLQPVIAIFDDVHWYDTLSLGLLNELVVRAQDARMLLIVTCRPEYRDDWRDRQNYRQLRLDPLTSENLAELLRVLLGSDPSVQTLKSFLVERASGNPFFVEEIVRSLVDTGVLEGARGNFRLARPVSSLDVPPTVQAVLAARIDGLPAAEKRLLQEAAVIGHDVPFALLHSICGLPESELRILLDNVQAAEFLNATQLFPDPQYTFTHSLTHDVAYNSVLRDRRRDIHARIVGAIEELYAHRLNEQIERLAHHAVRGELREKSVQYLRQAGGKAAARSALGDARIRFEQALAALKTLPESRESLEQAFEIRLELRPVLRQLGEGQQMLDHLRDAEAVAAQLEDDRRRGLVCAYMITVQSTLDELDEALATGARALQIAERLGDDKLRVVATSYLEQAYCYRGDYEHVVELASKTLATLPSEWNNEYLGMAVPAAVFDRAWLIMSLAELGRFAQAAPYEAEVINIAEPTQHAFTIGWAHFAASMPPLLKGDWLKARARVEQWITMIRTGNVGIHLPWAIASSAWALAQIGEATEALNRAREAEQLLERQAARGIVGHRGWAFHAAGRACLLLGRLDDARRLADRAIATSRRQPGFAAHAHHLLGDIAAHPSRFDPESVARHYQDSLKLAQQHGMQPLVAHCHFGLGRHHRRTGKPDSAREHFATATSMYRDMDMGFWLNQCEMHSYS
jgi:class 3 adenylate cyclase/tetratricopeptide (TPR) repeat protein